MKESTVLESAIKSVGSAILHVQDLRAMVKWYGDIFGIPITDIDPEKPFYVFTMDNGVNLMLDDHRFMQDQAKHPICMLNTLDIEKSYHWVKHNGIPIVLDIQHIHPGLSYFNIMDPEGNVLMIVYSTWVNPDTIHPNQSENPIQQHINSIVVSVTDLKRATEWSMSLS